MGALLELSSSEPQYSCLESGVMKSSLPSLVGGDVSPQLWLQACWQYLLPGLSTSYTAPRLPEALPHSLVRTKATVLI